MPTSWKQSKDDPTFNMREYSLEFPGQEALVLIHRTVYSKGTNPSGIHAFFLMLETGEKFRGFAPAYWGNQGGHYNPAYTDFKNAEADALILVRKSPLQKGAVPILDVVPLTPDELSKRFSEVCDKHSSEVSDISKV
jgi:hypothetical protein